MFLFYWIFSRYFGAVQCFNFMLIYPQSYLLLSKALDHSSSNENMNSQRMMVDQGPLIAIQYMNRIPMHTQHLSGFDYPLGLGSFHILFFNLSTLNHAPVDCARNFYTRDIVQNLVYFHLLQDFLMNSNWKDMIVQTELSTKKFGCWTLNRTVVGRNLWANDR